MEFYKSDLKLKKFRHIIENSPVYPVLYDHNRSFLLWRAILSLPSIINGAHFAITLKTKNVFIECTATDLTKAKIVLNTMVTMFSMYCKRKFEVEPVEVIYSDGKSSVYLDLSLYHMEAPLSYATEIVRVPLEANETAMSGFTEVLTWVLCTYKENSAMLNCKDDKSTTVITRNPRSSDFEMETMDASIPETKLVEGTSRVSGISYYKDMEGTSRVLMQLNQLMMVH